MNIDTQIEHMNQMLKYLGRTSFQIDYMTKGGYQKTFLRYTLEDSTLWKETVKHNIAGNVTEHIKKEKAMGGTNGDDMYKAIKKAAIEKAEKAIRKRLVQRELE